MKGFFQVQPAFCSICGTPGEYGIYTDKPILCKNPECREELNWRYVLYVRGKPYRPRTK